MASFSSDSPEFGSCCKDLNDAMNVTGERFIRSSEDEVLYLTVAAVDTEEGTAFMDQAVLFCPFCGKQLQTVEEIQRKAGSEEEGEPQ
jgi:hypothetical protein